MRKAVLAALAALACAGARAEDCRSFRNSPEDNLERVYCLSGKLQEADQQLNFAYGMAMSYADEDTKRSLRESQQRWLRLRNRSCSIESSQNARQVFENIGCATRMTNDRAAQLQSSN